MKKVNSKIALFLFACLLISCGNPLPEKDVVNPKIKIAYSKNNKAKNYSEWLQFLYKESENLELYNTSFDSLELILGTCDGILITGGNDISPSIYGKSDEVEKCEDFDFRRDSLEIMMIQFAIKNNIPLLGICRGEQIINAIFGGTLHTDIPTDIGNQVIHRYEDSSAYHHIRILENSLLHKICGVTEGIVNSSHHQAADKIANGFQASAFADDNVVEAIEFTDSNNFILGVQWHPERLEKNHKLSKPIGDYFVTKAKERATKR